jgi:hypothetical protein
LPKKLIVSPGWAGRNEIPETGAFAGKTYVEVPFTTPAMYGLPPIKTPWHNPGWAAFRVIPKAGLVPLGEVTVMFCEPGATVRGTWALICDELI